MDKKAALLLVITGFPRSGTTLLNQIVSSHPDIEVSFEFRNLNVPLPYTNYIAQLRANWQARRLLEWRGRFFRNALRTLKSAWFYYRFLSLLQSYEGQTIDAEIVLNSLKRIFPNKRYVGDKFPLYIERIPELSRISVARRIVIYRDIRHVVPSFHRKFAALGHETRTIAENWAKAMALTAEYQDSLHLIRYEDLLKNPQEIIQAMADYLDLAPEGFRHNIIRSNNDGDYRQKLSESELADIMDAAGEQMLHWDYH
jgi:hypothetical protein